MVKLVPAAAAAAAAAVSASARSGMPLRSDVMLTSRSQHQTPATGTGAGSGLYNTFEAGSAFFANRMDWVYSLNSTFVREALETHGYTAISLAMNANLPDPSNGSSLSMDPSNNNGNHLLSTYNIGRALNVHGEKITAPWMRAWAVLPYYGCVNNPDYRNLALDFAESLVKTGATAVQHDDPTTNLETTTWDGGNPNSSGCYCPYCMAGFTTFLENELNATQLAELNISSAFNYRDFILANGTSTSTDNQNPFSHHSHGHKHKDHHHHPQQQQQQQTQQHDGPREPRDNDFASSFLTDKAQVLREWFVDFQRNSTVSYIDAVRARIAAASSNLSSSSSPPATPLSCNNGGTWVEEVYRHCDYGLGELPMSQANPASLREVFVYGVPEGKKQVMTMPKAGVIREPQDVPTIRSAIAYAYALGSNMLVPWDIYLPTPQALRYFGDADEYADLFAFIRSNGPLLDEMDLNVTSSLSEGMFNLTFTGKDGDGGRWRLPSDATPVGGTCQTLCYSPAAAEWACLHDDDCKGIFYGADAAGNRVDCCTVNELEPIHGTAEVGLSYARLAASPTSPIVKTSDLDVVVEVRGSSGTNHGTHTAATSASSTKYALHVVNWHNNDTAAAAAAMPLNITVQNRGLFDCADCAACPWELQLLSLDNSTANTPTWSCEDNVTTISTETPSPWAVIVVNLKQASTESE